MIRAIRRALAGIFLPRGLTIIHDRHLAALHAIVNARRGDPWRNRARYQLTKLTDHP